jgi:Gpi18-like mannosyltransferase
MGMKSFTGGDVESGFIVVSCHFTFKVILNYYEYPNKKQVTGLIFRRLSVVTRQSSVFLVLNLLSHCFE